MISLVAMIMRGQIQIIRLFNVAYAGVMEYLMNVPVIVRYILKSIVLKEIDFAGEEHQLVGHNCYFCKRDLSYPPEGPIIENPELLPTVSILPCGHAFHDFCLQQITPPDEANDPPCIPCAIGEEP